MASTGMLKRLAASQTNAFVFVRPVEELQALVASQSQVGVFKGKLFGVKANFAVKNWPSDACSKMLDTYRSPFSATVVDLIEKQGGVLAGLTNMDEFGMGSNGQTSRHGPTLNPWNAKLSPGGSSSGSAAAVAEGLVFAALGSDTGGSVRLPASHCGVVGFKPSSGAVSRYGLIAYANSLDTVGILCQRVSEVEQVFEAIIPQGDGDGKDMTCTTRVEPLTVSAPIRVGLCSEFALAGMSPRVIECWKRASEVLAAAKLEIKDLQGFLPTLPEALPAYYVLALAEASSNLARYDGVRYGHRTQVRGLELQEEYAKSRGEGFGEEVQRRLLMGNLALTRRNKEDEDTSFYSMAQVVRQRLENDFVGLFGECDVLLLPTSPWPSRELNSLSDNVVDAFLEDTLTVPASLAGLPAVSVPCMVCPDTGSPIGMQIVGQRGQDRLVLHIASMLERGLDFRGQELNS
ncbi:aspartyl/glutamyl-tRNA(Asn/Gln) amidotransferase, A subunit [Batrachochytrium salamandrivorans]|nr:aspartyl/glutamyl-tRNA(Asn/Gln) amidotransferase, A subunit [Batrachochytrium salamandrivorans]